MGTEQIADSRTDESNNEVQYGKEVLQKSCNMRLSQGGRITLKKATGADQSHPLFRQVCNFMLNRMERGEWKAHDKLPSIRLLAEELKVPPADGIQGLPGAD